MHTHIPCLIVLILLAIPMLVSAEDKPPPKPAPEQGKLAPAVAFQGRIDKVEIDARRMTCSDVTMISGSNQRERVGGPVTFAVSEFARVWLDGREAQLRDLREGFGVRVEVKVGNSPELRTVDIVEARSR